MTNDSAKQSLADFLASYEPPPEDYEQHQATLEHVARSRQHFASATAPVVLDLRAHGIDVERLDDLDEPGVDAAAAVPVLLDHLPGVTDVSLIIALTKPLAAAWARDEAGRRIVELYPTLDDDQDPTGQIRFYLGQALERIADDSLADALIDLASDRRHGSHRTLVVESLARLTGSQDRTVPVLLELLGDPDVAVSAAVALGKLKIAAARPGIELLAGDPDPWVRDKARQALAKLPS